MAWRVANSLLTLRQQINTLYPNRDKSSDGTIGDRAHASRNSDHNPWVRDGGVGIVTACDITHDPASGVDAGSIVNALIASMDRRIKYIIWDRKIISGAQWDNAWERRPYTGLNPHTLHFHLSVQSEKDRYDDTAPWAIPDAVAGAVSAVKATMPTLLRGTTGPTVKELQKLLGFSQIDGMFGPVTEKAVKAFQRKADLIPDGKVGPYTWAALQK